MKRLMLTVLIALFSFGALAGCGDSADLVTLKIPGTMIGDLSQFDEKKYVAENEGIRKAKVNHADSSVSLTMTKEKQQEITDEIKQGLHNIFDGLVDAMETPYIRNVEHSNNFKNIKLFVDREPYEMAYDFTPTLLAVTVGMYQAYSGEEFDIYIGVHDVETGEEFSKVQYPNEVAVE